VNRTLLRAQAQTYVQSARAVLSRPDAAAYQERKTDELSETINSQDTQTN
jgi:hypothetical protein